jgi:hypothetical protein
VTRLPRAFEVAAGLLGIFTKGKEVKVVRKSHGYKAGVFLELCGGLLVAREHHVRTLRLISVKCSDFCKTKG